MNLTIVIPLYITDPLHLDFTRQTLATIQSKHNYQVILINNFCVPKFETELNSLVASRESLVTNPSGNTLAAAWNLGIKLAFDRRDKIVKSRQSSTEVTGSRNGRIGSLPTGEAGLREAVATKEGGSSNREPRIPNRKSPIQNTANRPTTQPSNYLLPTVHNPLSSDYCLILNNDILLHPQAIDNLVQFALDHPEFLLWSSSEWPNARTLKQAKWDGSFSLHPHFSSFMVSPKTVDQVGYFDENLKMAYFEDNDYHIRLLLSGSQAAATTTSTFYHYGSRTINVDDNVKIEAKYHYQLNRDYMTKKWGLDLHGRGFSPPDTILKEIYSRPFNNPKKSIKDW
jgi:hypothetical protein